MQTWAKRGIQTALMTGGMLALGAGIASAAEHCDCRPSSPLGGGVRVPIHTDNNTLGTPFGEKALPGINNEISTDRVNRALPEQLSAPAGRLGAPLAGTVNPLVKQTGADEARGLQRDHGGDTFRGNRATADLVIPVDISGNAIAAGGNASSHNRSTQSASYNEPTYTTGDNGVLSGNVLSLTGAVPVQLTGNAIGLVGNAYTDNHSSQDATAGGGVTTGGKHGVLSGNVLSGQLAAPVQGAGNAIGVLGDAYSKSTADSSAHAPGALVTNGDYGTLAGNAVGAPLGVPLGVNGNAVSGVGNAKSHSDTAAEAIAGSTIPGYEGVPAYVLTSGDHSVLSGNAGETPVSGPVEADGNALSVIGNTLAKGSSEKHTAAGGGVATSGQKSTGSGSVIEGPVALPVQGFGNSGAVIGNSAAGYDNVTHSIAGGHTFTNGDHSVLSGEGVNAPPAGAVDLFGNGTSVLGNSAGRGSNTTSANTGGYTGTTGNDATGSGNVIGTPIAPPIEGFGLAGALGGTATGDGSETKDIHSGNGKTNTNDDHGTLSSNILRTDAATPVQAFGDALGWVANVRGHGTNNTSTTAGGEAVANGTKGTGSGNITSLDVSHPAQLFGVASSTVGNGYASALNDTYSEAGGSNTTDGVGGSGSGNVAAVPVGGATQAFGDALSWFGIARGVAGNHTASYAGGDTETSGDYGSVSGNVLSPDVVALPKVFGDAVTVLGIGDALGADATNATAGGKTTTSGDGGSLSGNLVDAPLASELPQVFGDAATVGGIARAAGFNGNRSQVGGANSTSGSESSLSGLFAQAPVRAVAKLYDVPLEVFGHALALGQDESSSTIGEERALEVPVTGDGLGATELPSLTAVQPARARSGEPHLGVPLPAPALPELDSLPGGQLPGGQLPGGQLPGGQLPGGQLPGTPSLPSDERSLGSAPRVPAGNAMYATQELPVVGGHGAQLSGMRVAPGEQRATRYTRAAQSPALSALDSAELLRNLTDRATDSIRLPGA